MSRNLISRITPLCFIRKKKQLYSTGRDSCTDHIHEISRRSTDLETDIFAAFTDKQLNRRQFLAWVKLDNGSQGILTTKQKANTAGKVVKI